MMDYGMFGLGEEKLGETGEVCEPGYGCRRFPVHCLTAKMPWLEGSKAHRAQAVAAAWGGSIDHASFCSGERRRLVGEAVGTHLACQIRADAASDGAGAVSVALRAHEFSSRIVDRTVRVLGSTSDGLQGDLRLAGTAAWTLADAHSDKSGPFALPSLMVWAVVGCVAALLALSGFIV